MILESTKQKKFIQVYNDIKHLEIASLPFPASLRITNQLPFFPNRFNKEFFRGKARFNPVLLTCSCTLAILNHERDISLLCKHLSEFIITHLKSYLSPLTLHILSAQLKYGPETLYQLKNEIICGAKTHSLWISVYLLEELIWKRYSYNLFEKRWGFGKAPKNKDETEEIINKNNQHNKPGTA